jgi:hypothetical protein
MAGAWALRRLSSPVRYLASLCLPYEVQIDSRPSSSTPLAHATFQGG